MYACIKELHQKGSNNGVLPERHQATVRTSAGMLSKGPPEIVIQMRLFSLKILYCINVVCIKLILTRSQCVKAPDMVIALIVLANSWHGQLGTNYIYSS